MSRNDKADDQYVIHLPFFCVHLVALVFMGERPESAKCDCGHIRKNMKKSAEVIVPRKGEGRNQGNR